MAPLNILIVGGGIAGPATAFWLNKAGHTVTIIERFPALRAAGAQIDLRAQGIEAVKRMGLLETIRNITVKEDGIAMVDTNGRIKAAIMANKSGQGSQTFTSEFEIMRGDLVRVLYDATKDSIKYVFGTSVDSWTQDEQGVNVTLSNGETQRYDLLIGADGLGSRIRKSILPKDFDPYFHMASYCAYFTMPRAKSDDSIAKMYMPPGRGARWVMTRAHSETEAQGYLAFNRDLEELPSIVRASTEEQKAYFKKAFAGAGWETDRIIAAIDDTENWYCQEFAQVRAPYWSQGRVVCVADAAHCPSPNTGMGTTSGFVGAYMLAGEIASNPEDLPAALHAYEAKLRPFVTEIQKINLTARRIMTPDSRFGIWLLQFVLGWVSWIGLFDLIARLTPPERGGWVLPVYPALHGESS